MLERLIRTCLVLVEVAVALPVTMYGLAGAAHASDGRVETITARTEALLDSVAGGEAADVQELASFGSEGLQVVLDTLADDAAGGRRPRLTEQQIEALLRVAAAHRREVVNGVLALAFRSRPSVDERRAVLAVLGRVGTEADVQLAIGFAVGPGGDPGLPLGVALEHALVEILERHPAATRSLVQTMESDDAASVLPDLARVLGVVGGEEAVDALYHLLRFRREDAQWIVPELGRAARDMGPEVGYAVSEVESFLDDASAPLRREAALALGRMRAGAAVPSLVTLLSDPSEAVSGAALWALRRTTGMTFSLDPRRWNAWLLRETDWWEERFPDVRAALASVDPTERASALRELSLRSLYRGDLAAHVRPLLRDRDPAVRMAACQAMGSLGVAANSDELMLLLDDLDDGVAASAWTALKTIHGADLPPSPERWKEVVL